jgi:hypothetical protein
MPLAHSGGHFLQIHLESVSAIAAGFASAADASGPSAPWANTVPVSAYLNGYA